jgi:hypothetical protein
MSTTVTPTDLIAKAKRRTHDREVTFTWRSSELTETLAHTGEPVGVQITLDIEHDAKRKAYTATFRKVHWAPCDNPNITVTHWAPFDRTYWRASVMSQPVARFSAKSFTQFIDTALASLDNTMSETVAFALNEVARII